MVLIELLREKPVLRNWDYYAGMKSFSWNSSPQGQGNPE